MRPVDKGKSPYKSIKDYHDAEPYLTEKIGAYCSYCEFPISHVPEVEHKESKNSGGALTDWNNLLLACKYCNTRKKEYVKKGETNECIWPDMHNTFMAYTYEDGMPKVNKAYLEVIGNDTLQKAQNLYDAVKLGNIPTAGQKDRRLLKRREALNLAIIAFNNWKDAKNSCLEDAFVDSIVEQAKAIGFFSVWMMIFKDIPKIREALVKGFAGTKKEYFD